MDLTLVEKKLKSGQYASSYFFALDIRKIWTNSWNYNKSGSSTYLATTEISQDFEKLMVDVHDVPFNANESTEILELKKQVSKVQGEMQKLAGASMAPLSTKTAPGNSFKNIMERPMTAVEKSQLRQNIMKLPQDKLIGVIPIIRDGEEMATNNRTLEFDIETLPTKKCRELERYVKKCGIGNTSSSKKKKGGAKQESKKSTPRADQRPPPAPVAPLSRAPENNLSQPEAPPQPDSLYTSSKPESVSGRVPGPAPLPSDPYQFPQPPASSYPQPMPLIGQPSPYGGSYPTMPSMASSTPYLTHSQNSTKPEEKKTSSLERRKLSDLSDGSSSESGIGISVIF